MRRTTESLPQPVRTAHTEMIRREEVRELRSGPINLKSAPQAKRPRREMHDGDMRDIAVGEDDLLDMLSAY